MERMGGGDALMLYLDRAEAYNHTIKLQIIDPAADPAGWSWERFKATCLAVYLAALLGASVTLPAGIGSIAQKVAVVLVVLHVLEPLAALRIVKRHRGPLVDSTALTLLFGFLHWKPLTKRF